MKKKSKLSAYAVVHEGGLAYKDVDAIAKIEEFYALNVGKTIIQKYEVVRDVKSYEQLRFYFGVVVPAMCEATGNKDRLTMDEQLRYQFLREIKQGPMGEYVRVPSLSIDANQVDRVMMSGYINDCLELLAECGGSIDKSEIDQYESVMLDDIEGQGKLL